MLFHSLVEKYDLAVIFHEWNLSSSLMPVLPSTIIYEYNFFTLSISLIASGIKDLEISFNVFMQITKSNTLSL